jgi:hypothetical protein
MAREDSDTVNYRGTLFLIGQFAAPFLASIASKTKRSRSWTFPVAVPYSITTASQDTQSEDTAAAAGTPTTIAPGQDVNVAQIMKYDVGVTYRKQSQVGQFSGVNSDDPASVLNPLQFQIKGGLLQFSANMEFSVLQGSYTAESSSATNTTTRGLKNAITTNTVDASGLALSKDMLEELVRKMVAQGSPFIDPVVVVNSFQMQMLSDIYGYAPMDRGMGGVYIKQFMVPGAGGSGILTALYSPQQPEDELYIVERSIVAPVFVPVVPFQDGNVAPQVNAVDGVDVMYQPIAPVAAAQLGFLYTQFGFDHGPEEWHGSITGLAKSR